jgi:hypothetical protein
MKAAVRIGVVTALMWLVGGEAAQPAAGISTEEFGLTRKQLFEAIEKVESLISTCMRAQGFEYVAVDYNTVRKGMSADKKMPGMSEGAFIAKFGFGVSTTYTGEPPQLATGYMPGREGLGERNIQIFKKLPVANQVAYNRALFGENTGATFAVSLETENFSLTGGCTRKGISQVFNADQMTATYYNPKDALINKDPRMKDALSKYQAEMRKAGYAYNHPDKVELDIRTRLAAMTMGGTIRVDQMTPTQRAALKELQAYELKVAVKNQQLLDRVVEPVYEKIEGELFARKPL